MHSYETSLPRSAFGLAAAAMAALTLGAMVVLPAQLGTTGADPYVLASAKAGPPAPVEVTISPARIDVIVMREPNVAWALTEEKSPNCKPQG
jgi:hypothetical protein